MRKLFLLVIIYIAITTSIYKFKNSKKTDTEVFLHIPKSLLLDFGGDK